MPAYAHTLEGRPPEDWEPLERHLQEVAEMAGDFASAFGAREWGRLAGLWHDLGKYSREFQDYLTDSAAKADPHSEDCASGSIGRVDHSTAGAQHAACHKQLGPLMAYIIAGHHAGLPNGMTELKDRLIKQIPKWLENCPAEFKVGALPMPPLGKLPDGPPDFFRLAFHLRMVFSALVDADFLCTEGFMSPAAAAERPEWPENVLERMEQAVLRKLDSFDEPQTHVDVERLHVRQLCESAADQEPGFFDLTVPTGGGKTLASLLFALRHARQNGLRRVVCAIPFTSIIEQNAQVYRDVFAGLSRELGHDVVIEHHSNLLPEKETTRNRLATENWDAPLIVTTNVQLFESLFACRTSACRKLHRLARSVIVLDEAQALPVSMLRPILASLRCLLHDHAASVVFCTATQPALERREGFDAGIPQHHIRSIIPDPARLYASLRRTEVVPLGITTNDQLRNHGSEHGRSALFVVNSTKAARELFTALDATAHLSARMCPAHRSEVLARVMKQLIDEERVLLVSTPLIEAGVDVSFPVVYRAECGLDSLAQSAGRCNRHGELRDESGAEVKGQVFTFNHAGFPIPKPLVEVRARADDASQILAVHGDDPLSLEAIEAYFRLHIWTLGQQTKSWDQKQVMDCFASMAALQFRDAADKFQMISSAAHAVIIPWGSEGITLCDEIRQRHKVGIPPSRSHFRRAQRLTVQVYEQEWKALLREGRVESLHDGAIHLIVHPENDYDARFGLKPPASADHPEAFYC